MSIKSFWESENRPVSGVSESSARSSMGWSEGEIWEHLIQKKVFTLADKAIYEALPDTGHMTAPEIATALSDQPSLAHIMRRLQPGSPLRRLGLVTHEGEHGYRKGR